MPQESLLPDTKAIPKGTVEIGPHRNGYLVRYKNLEGVALAQRQFKDVEEANRFFWECAAKLKAEVQSSGF